jgi:hypothetical protein
MRDYWHIVIVVIVRFYTIYYIYSRMKIYKIMDDAISQFHTHNKKTMMMMLMMRDELMR